MYRHMVQVSWVHERKKETRAETWSKQNLPASQAVTSTLQWQMWKATLAVYGPKIWILESNYSIIIYMLIY